MPEPGADTVCMGMGIYIFTYIEILLNYIYFH
jgi:hypothetical protein